MSARRTLRAVAMAHALLTALAAAALSAWDIPAGDVVAGGLAIGAFFFAFWGLAEALVAPARRRLTVVAGALKALGYPVLAAASLSAGWSPDARGFGMGVTCFVVAALVVALVDPRSEEAA